MIGKVADPLDQVIELELPEELRESFETELHPKVDATPPAEPVPVPEHEAVVVVTETPAKPTPPRTFDTVESARTRYLEEMRVRQAVQPARTEEDTFNYNEGADFNANAKRLREHSQRVAETTADQLRGELTAQLAGLSEEMMVDRHPDNDEGTGFHQVITKSGALDLIRVKDEHGNPVQCKDPFLNRFIYSQPNPAKALYEYGLGRLSRETVAGAGVRGEERGRREVVQAIEKNAARPVSIASLPSSGGRRTALTLRDIANLSDEKKDWIKKNRKDLWDQYLGKPE